MRALPLKCFSCISTLRKVKVPARARKKIIQKHYPKRKHRGQSTFFKSISPRRLFNEVTDVLRPGIKANEIQGPPARSDVRYIYYYTFAFKVGIFRPNRHRGFATKTVKIVCKQTKCAKCGRHWPSEVVTIFPYRKPFIWLLKTATNVVWFSYFRLRGWQTNWWQPWKQRHVGWTLLVVKDPCSPFSCDVLSFLLLPVTLPSKHTFFHHPNYITLIMNLISKKEGNRDTSPENRYFSTLSTNSLCTRKTCYMIF